LNLYMNLSQLRTILEKEPGYRLGQVKKALFQDLIHSWEEAVALPLNLRDELNKGCPIDPLGKTFVSKEGDTIKALITLEDGLKIETVLMRHQDKRNTVCVSSQVGCPLGCSFCATGKIGFERNLEAGEIVGQVLFFARFLKKIKGKVTNVVFMGMGEPFLNYENVIKAIIILNDKEGFGLGSRHFSISTVGILDGIEKLAKEKLQINLAISLHAPDDELRSQLIPINKEYSLKEILDIVDGYIEKTRRRVMFEYIMIRGVNDSEEHARTLAELMRKPLYFVNLISCNPIGIFKPSLAPRMERFKEILEGNGVVVTQRYRLGQDIEGACGQLAVKNSSTSIHG